MTTPTTTTPAPAPSADIRNAELTYAAGDVIAFIAQLGVTPPAGFEDLDPAVWKCLGWMETSGYIFKLDDTTKEVTAAGTLSSIRTIMTGGTRTIEGTYLEALNPNVRSLFDDVPVANLQPGASGATAGVASYVIPETPSGNMYAYCFDTWDGAKRMRLFGAQGLVTTRGNDQPQQADVESLQMTTTFYPSDIGGVRGTLKRYINYGGIDMTPYFATT